MSLEETLETLIRKAVRDEMKSIIYEDRLLTTQQVAETLGSNVARVRELARDGYLKRVNLGEQSPRYKSSEVQRLVQQGIA